MDLFSLKKCLDKNCCFRSHSFSLKIHKTLSHRWFHLFLHLLPCYWETPVHRLFNTWRQRQNGHNFTDNIFKYIFLNANVQISINISLKFVPQGQISNIPVLVQIMAWRRTGNKLLSEPMVFDLLMQLCVTRPQWVESILVVVMAWCCPTTSH